LHGALKANDIEKDSLTYSIESSVDPAKGTLVLNNASTGVFTYTPLSDFTGTATFTYKASDSGGASSEIKTVTVTVVEKNLAPILNDDPPIEFTTNEDTRWQQRNG
jgi:hypothetical protein